MESRVLSNGETVCPKCGERFVDAKLAESNGLATCLLVFAILAFAFLKVMAQYEIFALVLLIAGIMAIVVLHKAVVERRSGAAQASAALVLIIVAGLAWASRYDGPLPTINQQTFGDRFMKALREGRVRNRNGAFTWRDE